MDASKSYEDAMKALGTLISSLKRSTGSNWEKDFRAMHTFLETLQLEEALRNLKVIHVAGTKGKGSTCCMVESMLRAAGYRTGLFTSPHLCDVRERIRIDGRPLSRDVFLKHFWDCFATFEQHSSERAGMPAYFRFLTLLGFKVFIEEGVDVAVMEVGLGGRLDATNIVPNPVVCGVSSLGFDHMELLGHTLREIATEKAGIFKGGSPALTIPQPEEAQLALQAQAAKVSVELSVVAPLESYRTEQGGNPSVGLAGSHQEVNAALAIALAAAFEAAEGGPSAKARAAAVSRGCLPEAYSQGLAAASWPGRCQIVQETVATTTGPSQLVLYLDGAHTPESMEACAKWFADASRDAGAFQPGSREESGAPPPNARRPPEVEASGGLAEDSLLSASPRAGVQSGIALDGGTGDAGERPKHAANLLIFNCMQEREPEKLLRCLLQGLQRRGGTIHAALFVPPDSLYSSPRGSAEGEAQRSLAWQLQMRETWDALLPAQPPVASEVATLLRLPAVPKLAEQDVRRGAVLPGLRTTMEWLRSCAKQRAGLRIQVLVTGSLYLVGDVLRHLGQEF